jgi:hypothetical protein
VEIEKEYGSKGLTGTIYAIVAADRGVTVRIGQQKRLR